MKELEIFEDLTFVENEDSKTIEQHLGSADLSSSTYGVVGLLTFGDEYVVQN